MPLKNGFDHLKNSNDESTGKFPFDDINSNALRSYSVTSIFKINKELNDQLVNFSKEQGVTLFMTVLAALKVLLYRYSGSEDICVFTPTESFLNIVALGTNVNGEETFKGLLQKIKGIINQDNSRDYIPVETLSKALGNEGDTKANPLYQFMFVLHNDMEGGRQRETFLNIVPKFGLTFSLTQTTDHLMDLVAYSTGLFTDEDVDLMVGHYGELLKSIIKQPLQKIGELPFLTREEEHQLLFGFNNSSVAYPKDKTIINLFEEQASINPDKISLVFEDEKLTYKELNERSNLLARYLISKGVIPETPVPVCIERSAEMVVAVLGILKAGGAYVPIDPEYPEERMQYILEDIKAKVVLTSKVSKFTLPANGTTDVIVLDEQWQIISKRSAGNLTGITAPSRLAYIIYTSGSTGKPKGVMVQHDNLLDYLFGLKQKIQIDKCRSFALLSTISADLGNTVIYSSLAFGGTLHVFSKETINDIDILSAYFKKQTIDCLKIVPSHWETLCTDEKLLLPARLIIFGGEALKAKSVETIYSSGTSCIVINHYGPTETTIGKLLYITKKGEIYNKTVPIGKPFSNTRVYVLTDQLALCPIGIAGQLFIGGDGVARGYYNNCELTEARFIRNPFSENPSLLYQTGDMVKYLPGGDIQFLGRVDGQVKIRGYRIELAEIEAAINRLSDIKQAIVLAREDVPGQKRLVAYLVSTKTKPDTDYIRKSIEQQLPDFMHPSAYVWLSEIPITANGKVDRKNFPKPDMQRPELSVLYKSPSTVFEKNITEVWKELLLLDKIGIDDNFFHLGGNSLLAIKSVAMLKQRFGYEVKVTKLYQYPTTGGIANLLSGINKVAAIAEVKKNKNKAGKGDIAIIGMAGRFPGANTIDEFWNMLTEGREAISFFTDAELDPSISECVKNDPNYVKARGILNEGDEFDATFFGFNARSAELMDPQHRVFLELAWEVLENSDYFPQRYEGSIGVFAGSGFNTYYKNIILNHSELFDKSGQFLVRMLNEKDYIATRTAFQLNLKGPAVSVHSACSTSLLAIAQAVNSIRNGQCDVALAGAASITWPLKSGHFYEEGSIMSSDGHTRCFDAGATGTVFSDGAGVVLLKSLEDAGRDGDIIYAVIKGVGINNDGSDKGSFGGPSAQGQAGAISMAINDAGIDSSSISYVEAHGTATPLGDPIEIEGLTLAFGAQVKKQFCAIGSVKSNLGHLTAASGVAGIIKTVLALHHKQLPPSLFYNKLNPNINLADSPFYVNTELKNWDTNEKRYAGVSSFGFGGTNVHVILEEFENATAPSGNSKPLTLVSWSAKNETSVNNYAKKLASYIENNEDVKIADVAYSLQNTREDFNSRRFIIAAGIDELLNKLRPENTDISASKILSSKASEIVFMFPGQGSQYVNMGKDLYENEPVFAAAVNECIELLKDTPHAHILNVIFPVVADETAAENIKNTFYTQPGIFIMEYAMAKLWMSWGIQPSILIGHSIGEFVAAHFAGVFDLKDALKLISARARMVSEVAKGSMLSVRLDADQMKVILPGNLSIAAVNSNKLCVVAGEDAVISEFAEQLVQKDIPGRLLQTSHAFHSAMMDDIVAPFEAVVRSVKLNPPLKPIISTVTGKRMSEAEATNPAYWAQHLRKTVRFANAVDTLQENESLILLEVGPGFALATLARQQVTNKTTPIVQGFEKNDTTSEYYSVLKALGQLWLNGIEPDWKAFYQDQQRLKIKLPTYAFDHKRYGLNTAPALNLITPVIETTLTPAESPLREEETEQIILQKPLTRKDLLISKLKKLFADASGIEMDATLTVVSFIEIGFDSILLMQMSTNLKREYKVPITIRKLFEEYNTIDLLATYLDANLPEGAFDPFNAKTNLEPVFPGSIADSYKDVILN